MAGYETSPTLMHRLRDPADAAAWGRFQTTYADLVVRYCRSKGLQPADAEDVWQHALLKLSRALTKFQYDSARGRFRDFLFVVVRSAIADVAQRRLHGTAPVAVPVHHIRDEPVAPVSGDEHWENEWRDFHFRRAWDAIRHDFEPRSLEAFQRILCGDPIRQVAGRFAMSEQGLHKIKQRIRDRLAAQVRTQVMEEDGGE